MVTSFKDMSQRDANTVIILDALNLGFRWKHSGAKTFAEDYVDTVNSFAKSYKSANIIIACDQGSSSYRKSIYPLYKQNRKDKYELQTPEEAAAFEAFFTEFSRTISVLKDNPKYLVLRFDKCEADDIAAYITRKVKKTKTVWLLSSDADWDLLIDKNVSRFSYVSRKEITLDNWSEHYEYDIDDHISVKCLTGDTGDNIPGVPGIGPKKAHALVKEFGSTYDIISSLPINSRYKHINNLNEFGREALLLNYKLMDLVTHCAEALGEENCKFIDRELEKYLERG
jgi:protein Xni